MAKLTLKTVLSGFNLNSINENFQALVAELQDKVLYRDNPSGEPNQWETQQDANSQRLINLQDAVNPSEPATLRQLNSQAVGVQSVGISRASVSATAGQTLFSTSGYVLGSNNLNVYVNGVRQAGSAYTETSTTSFTLSEGAQLGDNVEYIINELPELAGSVAASAVQFTQSGAGAVTSNVQTKLEERVSVKDFGAVGDGVTIDDVAIIAALAASNNVFFPSGVYIVSNTIQVPSNCVIHGSGIANTNIQASADGVPNKIFEMADITKSYIRDLTVSWLGDDTGVSIIRSSKCTVEDVGGNALNQNTALHGIFINMDMDTNPNAYTHTIRDCDMQGALFFVHSTGPITGCVFEYNTSRSGNGYRFIRGTTLAGSAPIVGNSLSNNLIQAHATTIGTGTGIDFGVGDAASPTHSFANFIDDNYIERWATGLLFRDGSANNSVGANEWDNNTINITDSTPNKDAYSQFAGTQKFFKLAEFEMRTRPAGFTFGNQITGDVNYDGDKIDKAVTANDTTVTVNGRTLRMTGVTAPRTGTILDVPGDDIDGQICILTGTTWSVTFLTTNIDIAAGFTMGNGSGEYSGMVLQWDKTISKWLPISSFLRP